VALSEMKTVNNILLCYLHVTCRRKSKFFNGFNRHPFQWKFPSFSIKVNPIIVDKSGQTKITYFDNFVISNQNISSCQVSVFAFVVSIFAFVVSIFAFVVSIFAFVISIFAFVVSIFTFVVSIFVASSCYCL
jgi:hypothetical protein